MDTRERPFSDIPLRAPGGAKIYPLPGADFQRAEQNARDIRARGGDANLLANPVPHRPNQGQQLKARLSSTLLAGLLGGCLRRHGQMRTSPSQTETLQRQTHRAGAEGNS